VQWVIDLHDRRSIPLFVLQTLVSGFRQNKRLIKFGTKLEIHGTEFSDSLYAGKWICHIPRNLISYCVFDKISTTGPYPESKQFVHIITASFLNIRPNIRPVCAEVLHIASYLQALRPKCRNSHFAMRVPYLDPHSLLKFVYSVEAQDFFSLLVGVPT
jgi:hypothetical protein